MAVCRGDSANNAAFHRVCGAIGGTDRAILLLPDFWASSLVACIVVSPRHSLLTMLGVSYRTTGLVGILF